MCDRCGDARCNDPDSKWCSDILLMRYKAERDALAKDAERWQAVLKSRFMLCDFDVRESGHFRTTKLRLVDAAIDAARSKP